MNQSGILQEITISDNFGNTETLKFELPQLLSTDMETQLVAMKMSHAVGVLETLGHLSEGCFHRHLMGIMKWADEYVKSGKSDLVLFMGEKMEFLKKGSNECS